MVNIAFRVDGGPSIGMGHVSRCLALADSFSNEHKIIFISQREKAVIDRLEETRFDIIPIEKDIDYEEEIDIVKKILKEKSIDIFIGDIYASESSNDIDEYYISNVKDMVDKTVLISPKDDLTIESDIVINGNAFADDLDYKTANDDVNLLLGEKYALLRKEFQNLPERGFNEKVKNIIVTVGGSDPLNLIPKALKAINKMDEKDIHVDVVVGPAIYDRSKIISVAKEVDFETSLLFNPSSIGELMQKADLAVSAGGTTLYELAATGTPAIVILQAENQIPVAESMEDNGTIINLGLGNEVKTERLAKAIIKLMNDPDKRKKMSEKGKKIVDGLGTKRCVEAIIDK